MTDKRRGLGRGLGALIPNSSGDETGTSQPTRPVDLFFPEPKGRKPATTPTRAARKPASAEPAELVEVPGATFMELPVGEIHPNRKQPRTVFNEEDMAELVHSVREIGVLQPIVVRKSSEKGDKPYELVMGERRWRASQAAGLATIPVIVRDTSDDNLLRDALLENLHRSQLNPLEEAAAYQQLLEDFGTTHEQLADRIGRSRPQVSNTLRLLKLPPVVQRRVAAGILSAGHARALLALPDSEAMENLAQKIVAEGMSVRATEEAVQLYQAPLDGKKPASKTPSPRHERLDFLATSLADRLDTNVKISLGARKGKVSIEFASVADLNRIMDVLSPGGN
ncbi:ParB/RepB/Spo0J family partition protein [Arthrobacter sp. Sr24]